MNRRARSKSRSRNVRFPRPTTPARAGPSRAVSQTRKGRKRTRPNPGAGAPIALRAMRAPRNNNTCILRGTDIVDVIRVSNTNTLGTVLYSFEYNPALLAGTRLKSMAGNWLRWRPVRTRIGVQGSAPTIIGGQVGVMWLSDAKERLPRVPLNLLRKVGATEPHMLVTLWDKKWMSVNTPPVQRWLYVNPSEDDSRHGRFVVVITGDTTTYTGYINLTLQLDWVVAFDSTDVTEEETTSQIVRADEGYYPYFSTYSSKLTIGPDRVTLSENSSGGYNNLVRFSKMLPDTVYVPDDTIELYTSTTVKSKVGAVVRMKEVTDPLVWVFQKESDAQEYIKTSDINKVAKFYVSGGWSTGNPNYRSKVVSLFGPQQVLPAYEPSGPGVSQLQANVGAIADGGVRIDPEFNKVSVSNATHAGLPVPLEVISIDGSSIPLLERHARIAGVKVLPASAQTVNVAAELLETEPEGSEKSFEVVEDRTFLDSTTLTIDYDREYTRHPTGHDIFLTGPSDIPSTADGLRRVMRLCEERLRTLHLEQ
nr:hypothetical protein [Leuven wasp-associated virus 6]